MDKQTLQKIAQLARLELPEDELQEFHEHISQIVSYVDQLSSIDMDSVEPIYFTNSQQSTLRADQVGISLTNEEALANSSRTRDGQFRVPQVVDQG